MGRPGRAFYPEEHGVPAYDELILVAHRDRLEDPRLRRFVAAVERATIHILNHPQAAWEVFVEQHPDLDDALNRRAWRDTIPRLALRPAALDRRRYERFAAFAGAQGLVRHQPPVAEFAVELP